MAWTFVGISNATTVASGNITLTEPAGCQAGDILVACIAIRDTPAFSMPSGWTQINQQNSGNTESVTISNAIASGLMAWIRRGDATPADRTFTRTAGNVAFGRIVALRSDEGSADFDAQVGITMAAASTSIDSGSGITTAEANEFLVMMIAGADDGSASAYSAATDPTAGWTERADTSTTTGADTHLAVATNEKATAGATGNFTATHSDSARHVIIVAAFKQVAFLRAEAGAYSITGTRVANPGVDLIKTYEANHQIDALGTDVTITGASIGTADVNRKLYIAINQVLNSASGDRTQDSVTVDGASATRVAGTLTTSASAAIWSIAKPTGATADIVISPRGDTGVMRVTIFSALVGAVTESEQASGNASATLQLTGWNATRFGADLVVASGPSDTGGTTDQSFVGARGGEGDEIVFEAIVDDASDPVDPRFGVYTTWHGDAVSSLVQCGYTAGSGSTNAGIGLCGIHIANVLSYTLAGDAGSYAVTGNAANLLYKRIMAANAGSYTVTGTVANLLFNKNLFADAGAYSILGGDATLFKQIIMAADGGLYSYSGSDAGLTIIPRGIWTEEAGVVNNWVEGLILSGTWTEQTPLSNTWTEES